MTTTKDSKTTTTTTEAPFAAVQNMFAALDPMGYWAASQQAFHKLMSDSWTRAQGWSDEAAAIEAQMFARANASIDTCAQIARETLAYAQQLSAQARTMSREAARKAGLAGA